MIIIDLIEESNRKIKILMETVLDNLYLLAEIIENDIKTKKNKPKLRFKIIQALTEIENG